MKNFLLENEMKSTGMTLLSWGWVSLMPLLAMPNSGLGQRTAYGVFDFSDFVLVFWIPLLLLDKSWREERLADRSSLWLVVFLAWSAFGVVSINVRYDYGSDYQRLIFSMMKFVKFSLYIWAGTLTYSRIKGEERLKAFNWALVSCALVQAIGLILSPDKDSGDIVLETYGYKSTNGAGVTEVILIVYIVLLHTEGYGSAKWRKYALGCTALGAVAVFLSMSRGAWLAAIFGLLYFLAVRGLDKRALAIVLGASVIAGISYVSLPKFHDKVEFSLHPELRTETGETNSINGVDEGGRIETWKHEFERFQDAPVLGAGFFHRGGLSPLYFTGSHNFLLQMLLETGIVGFACCLGLLLSMWRTSSLAAVQGFHLEVPVHGALVAAIAGLMGGEYFYGGFPLIAMVLLYAMTASRLVPISHRRIDRNGNWQVDVRGYSRP